MTLLHMERPAFAWLGLDVDDHGVATIELRRTAAKNAMDMALKTELAAAVRLVAEDPAVRAVVVTGSGDAFCAGGDIVEMALNDRPTSSRSRLATLLESIYMPLAEMEKPTLAAVNGHAHGSGLSLALACDVVIASDAAVLSCAFAKVGLVPDCGSLYFLPRRVSLGRAKELVFSARRVGAAEALELGLVERVVPAATFREEVAATARSFAAGPTVVLGLAKKLLDVATSSTLREVSELEGFAQAVAYSTSDHAAARQSFSTRTPPLFSGR